MVDLLTLSVVLPLLGGGAALLASLLPLGSRARRVLACWTVLTAGGATVIVVIGLGRTDSLSVVLSSWRPSLLSRSVLRLRSDHMMQPLALALGVATCSAVLVELGRGGETPPQLPAAVLSLLGAGLAVLWAANPLTMIVSWALYDLLASLGHVLAGGSKRSAVRRLASGGLATMFLWSGVLFAGQGSSSGQWGLMVATDLQVKLWIVAALLRLSIYPVHFSVPGDTGAALPLGAPLLLSPVVGWALWLRLAGANGDYLPITAWVLFPAIITLAVGGFLAWSVGSVRRSLPWIGTATTAAILLGIGLGEVAAPSVVAAAGAAWALGIVILSTGSGLDLTEGLRREQLRWWVPSLVGAVTLGFLGKVPLMGSVVRGESWKWIGASFVGQMFLAAALVRWLLSAGPAIAERRGVLRDVALGVGQGAPTLLLIVVGLRPRLLFRDPSLPSLASVLALPDLTGWLLWVVSLAAGGVVAWQDQRLRGKIGLALKAIHDLLRLDWLYELVVGTLEQGLSALRVVDEVLGGAGALLWSLIIFLVLVLVWSGR